MKDSTTSMTHRDSLDSRRLKKEINLEDLPKDIQHKIKLIEKAFK